uniref:hypothetical protein n=1 Tax=Salmonella sp. s39606 TaxID=3159643 RepID=UPI003981430F
RNLGRGVSKPKKNTVASLLAQSRAMGIKPTACPDVSQLNHQVSLLKSNVLGVTSPVPKADPEPMEEDECSVPVTEECDQVGQQTPQKNSSRAN